MLGRAISGYGFGSMARMALLVPCVGIALAGGYAFYLAVEKPAMDYFAQRRSSRRPVAALSATGDGG